MFGQVLMLVCCWICGGMFLGYSLYARQAKKPVWFWSGSTVDPETISDIPAYNRANARMWAAYSVLFWVCGVLGFFFPAAAGAVLTVSCLGGIPLLIIFYGRILKKYQVNPND